MSEIKVKSPVKNLVPNKHNKSPSKHSPIRPLIATPIRTPNKTQVKTTPNKDLFSGLNYKRKLFDNLDGEKSSSTEDYDNKKDSLHSLELKKEFPAINEFAAEVKQFKEIKVKSAVKKLDSIPTFKFYSKHPLVQPLTIEPVRRPNKRPLESTTNEDLISSLNNKRRLSDILNEGKSRQTKANDKIQESLHAFKKLDYNSVDNKSLILPQKYQQLAKDFRCTDYAVSMMYEKEDIRSFDKLKQLLEEMMEIKFDIKRLVQIQTVLNNVFELRYESIGSHLDNNKSETNFKLTISQIYNSNIDIKLTQTHLLERYQSFVNRLLDITKEHHNNYINNLGVNIEGSELCRWHPQFKLDEVPDIVPNYNLMPIKPKSSQISRQQLGLTTILTTDNKDNQIVIKSTSEKIKEGPLKGLSVDFLNKIRAKEAANLAQEMTRKPEVEKKIMDLKRLPELVRIIHSYFISEKELTIAYDEIINKLSYSCDYGLSTLDASKHVNYMIELLPDWIKLVEVKKGSYIKINKGTSLTSLCEIIKKRVNHLMNNSF